MGYTREDEKLIGGRFDELLKSCEKICNSDDDWDIIKRAFAVAKEAHKGVRRRSGEPYIIHPIAVARICVDEIGLGVKSVVASLLHDVVEDTDLTVEDISRMFTPKIASMVDGLTKISGVFVDRDSSKQAENFRKMLLTLLDDVRVILIKIADRLHNMRTLGSMPRDKQIKITSETLFLFAPLAYRLGLYAIKSELEDLSLRYLFPEEYADIEGKLEAMKERRKELIAKFDEPIVAKLRENGVDFDISGRVKSVYSVWRKMKEKEIPFEEVYDLFALRIVFRPSQLISERTQCWYIYELVTDLYPSRPDRLRDWITFPKPNGYEALHTTVMGPEGVWVEVQIRSERMNDVAEHGVAAHWKHKEATEDELSARETQDEKFDAWLGRIRDALSSPTENAVDFLDNFQRTLYASEIVVFTPKGESRRMPKGATVLDFAYEIHSKLGASAIGAKINHKIESIFTPLNSGDQIEVLTSKSAAPKLEWLDHVMTSKAKHQIKNYLRRNSLLPLDDAPVAAKEKPKQGAAKFLKFWTLFQSSGSGSGGDTAAEGSGAVGDSITAGKSGGRVEKFEIAECCIPIPGDDVTGYRDPTSGKIIVHKTNCSELTRLAAQHGEGIMSDIHWSSQEVKSFLSTINIQGIDRVGILMDLVGVITGELGINIRELKIQSHDGVFDGEIGVYVTNTRDLKSLITKIKKIKGIDKAQRAK